jgi:energy-coupling factor transport system ATP-binding protein
LSVSEGEITAGEREDTVLLFKNFSFRYRTQVDPTLTSINLSVKRGEKILILGPSGCGKSTLVHCINGIIPHAFKGESSGELFLLGRDARTLDIFEISKKAGTVLQDTDGQFVGLSAAEDIAFALENDCIPSAEMKSRVKETALLVDMAVRLEKSPHDLSGGQKQRISVAGVLVDDVEILLFDEPLANLDPAAGKDTIELIDDLQKRTGKTIIIVEHRLEDVLHRPVDRIILMDKGKIISDLKADLLLSTDLLKQTGIREPLYVSALKYAGIQIKEEMKSRHVSSLVCDYGSLLQWDSEQSKIKKEKIRKTSDDPGLSLELRNIHFCYNEQEEEVLKNISFRIPSGECAAIVGRNGSGKSTLAKCICGFLTPDSGAVFYNGQDLSSHSIMERAEKIGFVMQNPNQMISSTMIYDETAFGLRTRGISETQIKSKVYDTLHICGLYPYRNWPVNALSYGQRKRLTIASILVLSPSFLILDEPTAGQDYRHYTEFMEFILKLSKEEGVSMLIITHDMHLMLEYTTRAIVLCEGERIADNEPFKILTDDEIIKKAGLKRTSLYDLALNAGIKDPQGFVSRYITFDRSAHEQKKETPA